jgi:hypothetical protein
VYDVSYDYGFYPDCFGGVLIPQRAPNHAIPLYSVSAVSQKKMPMAIDCRVSGEKTLFQRPRILAEPCVLDIEKYVHPTSLIPDKIPYYKVQGLAFSWPDLKILPSTQWLLKRHTSIGNWAVERIKAPHTQKTPPMRSRAQLFPILKKTMPVQRKAIPPHRFSTAHRQKFRELLAARAQLPVNDMQIVGVYDRIFLAFFQSLSQREDGTLICTPKSLAEPGMRDKETVAVYLIVGKSFRMPGKAFQVVLPMSALQDEE